MHPRTRESLRLYAPGAEILHVGDSSYAYWREIKPRWNGKDDLVIIEQDIEITAGVLPSFASCSRPWCSFWYYGPVYRVEREEEWKAIQEDHSELKVPVSSDKVYGGLGCTKFSAQLQREVPFGTISKDELPWDKIDTRIGLKLAALGHSLHVHGKVEHHHPRAAIWLEPPGEGEKHYTWRHVVQGEA